MFSSDACCFRNGQLKQLNDGEGWEKQTILYRPKRLEKKIPENPTPYPFIYIFHEKDTPFIYLLSVTNGTPFNTLFRTLYPFWPL